MTDDHGDDLPEALPDDVLAVLARADVWEEPPPGLEDAVVGAIVAEAASRGAHEHRTEEAHDADVVGPDELRRRRDRRRGIGLVLAAAAAVAVLALGLVVVLGGGGGDDGVLVALSGTELAPDASATADVDTTPLGVKIVLDVQGLPGAPPGQYYQAWLRSPDDGVSAGTFHLRGGSGAIELWAGVDDPDYSVITVTLQDEGGGAESSGRVVLRGEWER